MTGHIGQNASSAHKLAAIMFTDIVGYTALMGEDEDKALEVVRLNREIQITLIEQYHGRWLKEMGDGVLSSFDAASEAVLYAVSIQNAAKKHNIKLRIGVHQGEVVFENDDVYGAGVNIASRIQTEGEPGTIMISRSVYQEIKNKPGFEFEYIGEKQFKNVAEPITIYAVQQNNTQTSTTVPSDFTLGSSPPSTKPIHSKFSGKIRSAVITFGLFLTIALAYFLYPNMQNGKAQEPNSRPNDIERSIAVLPFTNMSNEDEYGYFGDALTDEIIMQLYKIKKFEVRSRTSIMQYKETMKSSPEIGRELTANYLIEGSAQRFEDRIRIRVQLIYAPEDDHIWGEVYERSFSDIFSVQSEIAKQVADELDIILTSSEIQQIDKKSTENLEAYKLYLMGRFFWDKRTKKDLLKSVEYFEAAITNDPNYALAYAGLGDAYFILAWYSWISKDEGYSKAKEFAAKTVSLDYSLAEAHATLGAIACWYDWDWLGAEKELKLAIELKPNYANAHQYYAEYLDIHRLDAAARKEINRALELDPMNIIMHRVSAGCYANEGKFEDALKESYTLLEIGNEPSGEHWRIFYQLVEHDREQEAVVALQRILSTDSSLTSYRRDIENTLQSSGTNGYFRWMINQEQKKTSPNPLRIAAGYAYLGEKEESINFLEKAVEMRSSQVPRINNHRKYKDFRSHPRFVALLERMGLDPSP